MTVASLGLEAVPADLRTHDQWVGWRREQRDGKWTKVPYSVHTGSRASVSDPSTWASFEEAVRSVDEGRYDGVGFVFSEHDPYVGIDLDRCRDPDTGAVAAWALDIVAAFGSYTEVSPSGTGVHIIVRGRLSGPGRSTHYAGGKVEIYDRLRYFTVTGQLLEEEP